MVRMPPIEPVMRRIREKKEIGETVYSMAQAVPWYGPSPEALNAFEKRLGEPALHLYSPDPGLISARRSLAEDFRRRRRLNLDPETEIHLTCGASQAFLSALLTVTDPGDRVLLVEPYYFDHLFAVQFCGTLPVFLPMKERQGWEFPWEALEEAIHGARALVLVNPGNPTGAVLRDKEMKRLAKMTVDAGCCLILDETYERFDFSGTSWHPWVEEKNERVITLGSFSKSLGIPGWRLGYLFASSELLKEALKVQDSAVICAPTPAQLLMEECLNHPDYTEEKIQGLKERLRLCREALGHARGLQWRHAAGGFFTLAACPGTADSEAARILLERYGIGTIPGSAFGESGKEHLRISFGCLSDEQLAPAMEKLASVRL